VDVAVHPKSNDIYVARYEPRELSKTGSIAVYSAAGEEKGTIVLPTPQISGMAFDASGEYVYVTEDSESSDEPSQLIRFRIGDQ
jgi:DNA-binding beta-propeller fold protein YncE